MDEQTTPEEEDEQHTMELWRGEVNTNLREMTKTLHEVVIEVKQRPTRAEIEMMLSQKVNNDIFHTEIQTLREQHQNDLRAIQDDVETLKHAPTVLRGWSNTAIAAVGCLLTLVLMLAAIASVTVSIIALTRTH